MNSLIAAVLIASLGQAPGNLDADFETALGTAGLTTRTARFDENLLRYFRSGEFATPLYQAFSEDPWRVPFVNAMLRAEATAPVGNPAALLMMGGRQLGVGTRRTLLGNPNITDEREARVEGSLRQVLEGMRADGLIRGDIPSLERIPGDAQQAAALVLRVMRRTLDLRRQAFASVDINDAFQRVSRTGSEPTGVDFQLMHEVYRRSDLRYLFAGGHDLTFAATTAAGWLGSVPADLTYKAEIRTVWGDIILSGGTADTYTDANPALLVIDTGGDDTYINMPRNATTTNWCSVVIDGAGSDKYLSDAALATTTIAKFPGRKGAYGPGPAGALFGYVVLVDRAGNDLYRSHRPGLGSGRFGVAVMLDHAGDDIYDCYVDGLAFGHFGIGIVEDVAGKDQYYGFNQVQACGLTMGFGMLADRAGDDVYVANDETIDFPSPQSTEHNVSMAQGAGYGRRADFSDGHSLAGGLGILYDVRGNDEYTCGVFGQGVGYWEGVGMLWDGDGFDTYNGQWYVQGASAHFAVGYLEDIAGDDKYNALMNMAQGAGHDFSVGLMLDWAGNDSYKAPNLSLGAGNANGIGIFIEGGGNDTYASSGITLGQGAEATKNSLRSKGLCLGLFMDLGGRDTYPPAATWAKDAHRVPNWTDQGFRREESQVGIFWDR